MEPDPCEDVKRERDEAVVESKAAHEGNNLLLRIIRRLAEALSGETTNPP